MTKRVVVAAMGMLALAAAGRLFAGPADDVPLMQPGRDNLGWTFDLGREFPGAQGSLSLDASQRHDADPSLKLEGDFSHGGAYVRAHTAVPPVDPSDIILWLQSPDTDRVTLRLLDATGQCHQVTFKLPRSSDWQKLDFNLPAFFARTEQPVGTSVVHYESWGGAADQKWHGPLKSLDVLVGPADTKKVVDLWISGVALRRAVPADSSTDASGIVRLSFTSARLGNLLYPHDARIFQAEVEATRALEARQLALTYVVRDYDGAEQTMPSVALLVPDAPRRDHRYAYTATLDLTRAPLELGRYYELHASVPRSAGGAYADQTEFALLPEAAANSFPPSEIPFSSRDWDDRLTDYFLLSHRLGIRICGIWSGWDADHPDAPDVPGLDLCAKLGMGVIASTPVHAIEEHQPGYEKYTASVLRAGTRALIGKYGHAVHPFILSLGNEPHGTGARVQEDVKAYAVVYDAAKKADPSVLVLGTSVGPEEEFFRAGFGRFCDAYDFHAYEEAPHLATIFQQYRELFRKYGGAKPIWSTELGLDSQGVSRRDVAADMVKKFALFFANGGANLSWFDLLYPDPDGTAAGTSGAAHNVFDCRYGRYAPKLTAVIYYDLINTILDQKFVSERDYGDVHLYLFHDRAGRSLVMGWKDAGRQDVFLPLPGARAVGLIRIDSRRSTLDANGRGVTTTLDTDPVLISFTGPAPVPQTLDPPAAWFSTIPETLARGAPTTIALSQAASTSAGAVQLVAPPFWQVHESPGDRGGATSFVLTAPVQTAIRDANLLGDIRDTQGRLIGEIEVRLPVASPRSTTPER